MNDYKFWVNKLGLIEHPEGGFYKEIYRSNEIIEKRALPERFTGDRAFCTSIYFLLRGTDISAFHRIKQDEIWHFYYGSSLTIHEIDKNGQYFTPKLGSNLDNNEFFQVVVKAGCYFGATVNDKDSYSLVGCTVAPGFDFDDFEMAKRDELIARYPEHRKIIEILGS